MCSTNVSAASRSAARWVSGTPGNLIAQALRARCQCTYRYKESRAGPCCVCSVSAINPACAVSKIEGRWGRPVLNCG
eukprot:9536920-Alexandrium_andersonii.AAC.1